MQTKQGAIKARDKILKTRPDHYKTVGALGGRVTGVKKGFASDPERARRSGALGGAKSRRRVEPMPMDKKVKEAIKLHKAGYSNTHICNTLHMSHAKLKKVVDNL